MYILTLATSKNEISVDETDARSLDWAAREIEREAKYYPDGHILRTIANRQLADISSERAKAVRS